MSVDTTADARPHAAVTVTRNHLDEFDDEQLGRRVYAALAHSPATDYGGSYRAIAVGAFETEDDYPSVEAVRNARYDRILNALSSMRGSRADLGAWVRENLVEGSYHDRDYLVVAKS